ncbi:Cupin [Vibrio celticus]|uniref:Cupin n=1 Tax=Vibrio celticus TaxID=446372 RepID=A0A1C3JE06_9VIBR|nr:Cupin [Vibrio celticus]
MIEGVGDGAEAGCAHVEYRLGQMNPLLSALPDVIVIPFEDAPNLMLLIKVLSNESSQESSGQQYLMDKLSDALMALIFRHLIEQQKIDSGVFSALAHPRLASVVTSILDYHSIAEMASLAVMSRTQFIEAFKR